MSEHMVSQKTLLVPRGSVSTQPSPKRSFCARVVAGVVQKHRCPAFTAVVIIRLEAVRKKRASLSHVSGDRAWPGHHQSFWPWHRQRAGPAHPAGRWAWPPTSRAWPAISTGPKPPPPVTGHRPPSNTSNPLNCPHCENLCGPTMHKHSFETAAWDSPPGLEEARAGRSRTTSGAYMVLSVIK